MVNVLLCRLWHCMCVRPHFDLFGISRERTIIKIIWCSRTHMCIPRIYSQRWIESQNILFLSSFNEASSNAHVIYRLMWE